MASSTELWGQALLDFHNGQEHAAGLVTIDETGDENLEDLGEYFEDSSEPYIECAYSQCVGRILDVGAGVGRHSLALQHLGFDVVAIDASIAAADLLQQRGVTQAIAADIFEYENPKAFDTVLVLDSIGLAGSLQGLDLLFRRLHDLLKPGGKVVLDADFDPGRPLYDAAGIYQGQERWRLRYRCLESDPFPWLATLDQRTCCEVSERCGFNFQVVDEFEDLYIAILKSTHAD